MILFKQYLYKIIDGFNTFVDNISYVIKDEQMGFIMKNIFSKCITENVIRVLNHPNLEKISRNAHSLIENEYTYEKAVEKYKKVLESI